MSAPDDDEELVFDEALAARLNEDIRAENPDPTPAELAMLAVTLNGFAPFPADPQERRRLMAQAMVVWNDAKALLATLNAISHRVVEEGVRLADRGLVPQADSAAEAVVERIMAKGAMSFTAFVNRIAGSQRTDDNAARVSKWLAWLNPAADISAEKERLKQEAASPLAPTLADIHAKSFAEWAAKNRSAVAKENAKKRRR